MSDPGKSVHYHHHSISGRRFGNKINMGITSE